VRPLLDDRLADAPGDVRECLVPGHALPAVLAALARPLQRIEDAIRVVHLVERRRPLRAVAARRARVLGVALDLADLERLAVHVGQQTAGRLAVEARRRHQHAVALDALRPRPRVELDPVVPALARRVGAELRPAGSRIEGLAAALGGAARGRDAVALGLTHAGLLGERHGAAAAP